MLAAEYPFLNLFWTMMVFFGWIIWLVVLFMALADNFRRSDHSGWAKAGWTVFVIFVPVIGVLFYVVTRPHMLATDPG
jgi:uncharacterized membrane protein YhaH (DUF805 family)